MPSPLLITFSGVDCSGKSTQIALLAQELDNQDHRPVVFWHRPGYSTELDRVRATIRRVRPNLLPTAAQHTARERAFGRPGIRRAWVAAAVADTVLQYGIKVRGLLATGRTVICDRYVADAILDLELLFPEVAHRSILEPAFSVCARPDRSFLLMLPREEMYRRMQAKREPFEEPIERRDARYDAYRTLANNGNLVVVDSTAPVDVVKRTILAHLAG